MKSGPLPTLTVRKTGRIRVLIHASALVLAPDALLLGAIRTGRVFRTYFGALALFHRVGRCVGQQGEVGTFGHFVFPPAGTLGHARVTGVKLQETKRKIDFFNRL